MTLAIERTWKAKSWEIRLLQTVMGMTLVNGYLAFKYITDKEMTLREYTNSIALLWVPRRGRRWEGVSRRRRLPSMHRWLEVILVFPHSLFNGRALGLGGSGGEGQCRMCLDKHASGV